MYMYVYIYIYVVLEMHGLLASGLCPRGEPPRRARARPPLASVRYFVIFFFHVLLFFSFFVLCFFFYDLSFVFFVLLVSF